MSMDFTTILAGPRGASLIDLARHASSAFAAIGFKGGRSFLRAAYDTERGVFDEVFPDDEVRLDTVDEGAFDEWTGWSTEFVSDDGCTWYVLVGFHPSDPTLNVWIDVGLRAVAELWRDGRFERHLAAVSAMGRAVGAVGGYGHVELDFEPIAAADVIDAIAKLPGFPDEPSSLGIVASSICDYKTATEKWGAHFDIKLSTRGFYLLVHKEFAQRYVPGAA